MKGAFSLKSPLFPGSCLGVIVVTIFLVSRCFWLLMYGSFMIFADFYAFLVLMQVLMTKALGLTHLALLFSLHSGLEYSAISNLPLLPNASLLMLALSLSYSHLG